MDFNAYEKSGQFAYAALAQVVAVILVAAIKQRGELRLQQLQRRAKDPLSLRRKLEDAEALEAPEVEAIAKDLAGVRVVLYTNSDVSRFLSSGIIRYNFDVDWNRTKIHHPPADAKQASELFISNNYVVKLKDERIALPEYAQFAGMWCEIQVQTTLNHAWSEMAHHTIYKKPKLTGFGGELMRGIEARMLAIMRKYLVPAGYEFQKVLTDFERLSNGKELFERGALTSIEACADNNELYEILERFANHVLPHYDDYEAVSAEIIATVAGAVKRARERSVTPIDTPFGSLPGHPTDEIAALAGGTIDQLRYVDVEATFDTISDLYEGSASDEERKLWLRSAQTLSKHELRVWEQV
ncbi:MAG: RelA/SpoT domain-containing protein, partial [Gammaproteobacteria bacterium]